MMPHGKGSFISSDDDCFRANAAAAADGRSSASIERTLLLLLRGLVGQELAALECTTNHVTRDAVVESVAYNPSVH